MEIVVNEWLLDYLRPDATNDERKVTFDFINAWIEKPDKVVIRQESAFTQKLYRYMKASEGRPQLSEAFRMLHKLLLLDSNRTVILREQEITELPSSLNDKTPPDDKYLVETAHSRPNAVIVTTDERLIEKIKEEPGINIRSLEEFMQTYPGQQ